MKYPELIQLLRTQAQVLGSSGKGWGAYAGVNRQAAKAISTLLTQVNAMEREINNLKLTLIRLNNVYIDSETRNAQLEKWLEEYREEMKK